MKLYLSSVVIKLLLTVLSYTQAGTFTTKLSYEELNFKFSTFLSYEARNPCLRIGDVIASVFFFVCQFIFHITVFSRALVWWLFCKTWLACWLERFCKCATNSVGILVYHCFEISKFIVYY